MTTDALTLFARQLASWARQIIDNGRSPFRKVELSPAVQTQFGQVHPPLVFWINRQSLMAGGILVLPAGGTDENLEEAAACARALGLRHFVSWAPAEIVFWQTGDDEPQRCKSVRVGGADDIDIDRFRDELALVMDELKLLSVTGNIPPQELSEYYLVNLCLGYFDASQEKLTETFRIARGEGQVGATAMEPENWARRRAALSLFQLLALSYNDLLPDNVQPERLEQAMKLHLPELPAGLAPLPGSSEAVPLPEDVAVLLHHLFRRLGQVGWRHDSNRALATVRLLLEHLAPCLDAHFMAEPPPSPPSVGPILLINTFAKELPADDIHLVGSSAALAGAALERSILELPPFAETVESPFDLNIPAEKTALLIGALNAGSDPAPRQLRRKLEDSLRRSWPTRRFALSPRTPAWFYSLLHLLGLAAPGSSMTLDLAKAWLDQRFASGLFDLLEEHFVPTEIKNSSSGRHRVSLLRKPAPESAIRVVGSYGERHVPGGLSGNEARSMIILALQLPNDLYRLVAAEQLKIPSEDEWEDNPSDGLRVFASSSLGRGLWQLVDGRRLHPDDKALPEKWRQSACPLPAVEILNHLQRLAGRDPQRKEIDEELAFWLETELKTSFTGAGSSRATRRRTTASPDRSRIAEEISALVFIDGIPRFPEQYLFDYYRPELVDFQLNGPLRIVSSFFNCIELVGPDGRRIEVEGDETARAMILASYGQSRTISLPVDRELTAEILQRYCSDLQRLRQQLVRETHARIGDTQSAATVIEQVWERHEFPPWKLIAED